MKEYSVKMPITGYIAVTVEAETEDEAKEKAMAKNVSPCDSTTHDDMMWDICDVISRGNVFYGELNEIEIEEI